MTFSIRSGKVVKRETDECRWCIDKWPYCSCQWRLIGCSAVTVVCVVALNMARNASKSNRVTLFKVNQARIKESFPEDVIITLPRTHPSCTGEIISIFHYQLSVLPPETAVTQQIAELVTSNMTQQFLIHGEQGGRKCCFIKWIIWPSYVCLCIILSVVYVLMV